MIRELLDKGDSEATLTEMYCVYKHQGSNLTIAGSAELPPKQVPSVSPFTNTAVDFTGPMYVKNSDHISKTYICVSVHKCDDMGNALKMN